MEEPPPLLPHPDANAPQARGKPPEKAPPAPKPPPVEPTTYDPAFVKSFLAELDNLLGRGRFFEAESHLQTIDVARLPAEFLPTVENLRKQVPLLSALLRETQPGMPATVPEMWVLVPKNGLKIAVTGLLEREQHYSFQTISGIRSSISRDRVQSLTRLERHQARAEVYLEFEKKCLQSGITPLPIRTDFGTDYTYRDVAGKTASGSAFFDLADLCARNGISELLRSTLEEGLRRDPDLVQTVHEMKANRYIDALFYFLSIRAQSEAELTRSLLFTRYSDTRAFQERLDTDVRETFETFVGSWQPPPPETTPPNPAPAAHVAPAPSPAPPDQGDVSLPDTLPENLRKRCDRANQRFREAWTRIQNSDPSSNAGGWESENRTALRLLEETRDDYGMIQESLEKAGVTLPKALLDRYRETMMLASLCRKRARSNGR